MLSFFVSTLAFFIAAYFIRRYLDEIGVPQTMVRGLVVFIIAFGISYGVASIIDKATGLVV